MKYYYIKKDLLNKIHTKIYDNNDIKKYILDLVKYLGVDGYLEDIVEVENSDKENLAFYNFDTKTLKFDYKNMLNHATELYGSNSGKDKVVFINLNLLLDITHEIIHVYQNYVMHEFDYSLFELYRYELNSINYLDSEEYSKYYMCFIFEREAQHMSYEAIIFLIYSYIKNKRLLDYFISEFTSSLNSGYSFDKNGIKSPIEKLFNELYKMDAPTVSVDNLYDAYKLGLQINKSKKINDRYVKKIS